MRQRVLVGFLAVVCVLACGNEQSDDSSSETKKIDVGRGFGDSVDGSNDGSTCDGTLTGRIRDFRMTFPDMEPAHSGKSDNSLDEGIVKATIDPDSRKPIYAGGATGTVTTTGAANFDQWFRDVQDVNVGQSLPLKFTGPDANGVYSYDNQAFFPIDGQLLGNEGQDHNYSFTFELHTVFQYQGGETFTFTGDDDVFTFINDQLVVNLGGVHNAMSRTINVDSLGLTKGKSYPLDFFFAERHVTESHFRIDTSLQFIECGKIYLQ
ncbi:MAG TPA: fibro-slime domain-containing protein [Polyangiaceae bacterium]|nr:fibro-slime domain-containing protein [Polyangiaceae bacterium]